MSFSGDSTVSEHESVFNIRVVPWWTDQCSDFLNNIFK